MDVIWEVHIFLKDMENVCFSSCSIKLFANSLVQLAKHEAERHPFLHLQKRDFCPQKVKVWSSPVTAGAMGELHRTGRSASPHWRVLCSLCCGAQISQSLPVSTCDSQCLCVSPVPPPSLTLSPFLKWRYSEAWRIFSLLAKKMTKSR